MKNQNDLIVSIVAAVFAIGFATGFYFTQRKPVEPTPAPKVVTTAVALPATSVVFSNGLAGGAAAGPGGGFGAAGGRGPGGPPAGFGGPGGPPPGVGGPPAGGFAGMAGKGGAAGK